MQNDKTMDPNSRDPQRITELIALYFDGRTTCQEEIELKIYFSSRSVAPEHQELVPLFGLISDALRNTKMDDFDLSIDSITQTSVSKRIRTTVLPTAMTRTFVPIRRKVWLTVAVAATIALILVPSVRYATSSESGLYTAPRHSYVMVSGERIQSDALASKCVDEAFDAVAISDDALLDVILPVSE